MQAIIRKIKNRFDGLPIAVPATAFVLLCLFQNFAPTPQVRAPAATSGVERVEQRLLDEHYLLRTNLDRDLAGVLALKPSVFVLPINPAMIMNSSHELRSEARTDLTQIESTLHNEGVRIEIVTDLFPVWMTGASAAEGGAIPCPDSREAYARFLRNYEETDATLMASLPPSITWSDEASVRRWQVYFPIQVGYGSCGKRTFSADEQKQIAKDLAERRPASSKKVAGP